MTRSIVRTAALSVLLGSLVHGPELRAQTPTPRLLTLGDLSQLRDVSDPQVSPDGAWVAYVVTTTNTTADRTTADIWMTSWDGATTVRLTTSPQDELAPRWSPDGRFLSFLSDRGDADEATQL